MRVLSWNMHAPFETTASHKLAWEFLKEQKFDVALLQETRNPAEFADWCSAIWQPKYRNTNRRSPLWGTAVVARTLELHEPDLDDQVPWLRELEGSVAIARTSGSPTWLASVHAHSRQIDDGRLRALGHDHISVSTHNGSIWETDLIPFELRHLFGDETFIWGGDLNSAMDMDLVRGFTGGNGKLREIWLEGGSHDVRLRFADEEQQTYFAKGRRAYQLDHVFADAATNERVLSWEVDRTPVELDPPLSDHAPVIIELKTA